MLRAWILLLLHHHPSHGYGLASELVDLGLEGTKTRIYRNLRWLDEAGFIEPRWEEAARGPARRVYEVSDAGAGALDLLSPHLRQNARRFLGKRRSVALGLLDGVGSQVQCYEFTVHARLKVKAGDDGAAFRKIERMLGRAYRADPAVRPVADAQISVAAGRLSNGRSGN